MVYTEKQIDDIIKREKSARENICTLLSNWEFKIKDLEYNKKTEMRRYIQIIDTHLDASVDTINMMYDLCLQERESYARLRQQNEKYKRFIRNQGFNPNDLNWVNIDEI